LFALHQGGALFGKAHRLTGHAVGIPAVLQSSVIQLTAQVKVML
jgi:hypothetical protein